MLPKNRFTWVVVAIAIYAYIQHPPKISKEDIPFDLDKNLSKESKVFKKLQKDDDSREIVNSLVQKALKEQYGDNNLGIVYAKGNQKIFTIDTVRDSGVRALCSMKVVINYKSYLENGTEIEDTYKTKSPVTVKLGYNQILPALEQGVVSMREGSTRRIISPVKYAYANESFTGSKVGQLVQDEEVIIFEVKLEDVKGARKLPDLALQTLDTKPVQGKKIVEAYCGDKVKISYKMSLINAVELVGQTEATFQIGKLQMPLGLENGIIGMKIGQARTVIIDHNSLMQMGKDNILPFKIDPKLDQAYVFEVTLQEVL